MLRHKNIDRICCVALAATILLTCCFMGAAASGIVVDDHAIGYEDRLFDQSRVHTIDIVMDDWDAFLETCRQEVYSACTVIIDGETYGDAAIRGKGNTSLSSVDQYGNDRYSFKIEFDQYQPGRTYHGLDKLSLNNLIQDKTWMKDYVAYTLMNRMGVAAPLCSFAQIRVNGEAWGFYLAVEGVEESFLQRNYGSDHGELYKPDSMSFGGGRGNGKDFNMEDFTEKFGEMTATDAEDGAQNTGFPPMPGGFDPAGVGGFDPFGMADMQTPEGLAMAIPGGFDPVNMTMPEDENMPEGFASDRMEARGGMGGMGSDDVKLQYIDDDPASYSNIFDNAKTDVNEADKQRLINALKELSEGTDVSAVVDVEAVIRYFVVHNFLCNDDSYTGQMIHNYYLYEENGVLSMIPWDYNLAFGGFGMGGFGGGSGATSTVNAPIDTLVSSDDIASRPMAAWIFEDENYTAMYHEIYGEFIESVFDSGWFENEISRVTEMIAPYVEADENGFFTYDEFTQGAAALKEFCILRARSVAGQLDGSIPSTTDEQRTASGSMIDASHINLSEMGEFGMGGGKGGRMGGFDPDSMFGGSAADAASSGDPAQDAAASGMIQNAENGSAAQNDESGRAASDTPIMNGQAPGGFDPAAMNGQAPGVIAGNGEKDMPSNGQDTAFSGDVHLAETEYATDSSTRSNETSRQEDASVPGSAFPEADTANLPSEQETDAVDEAQAFRRRGERSGWASGEGRQIPGSEMTGMNGATQEASGSQLLLLSGCVLLLILALAFAKAFKSNR